MTTAPHLPISARSPARRLHGALAARLGQEIIAGLHRPGDRLGSEATLPRRLDVSRSAYREAVKVLAAKGLVESRPQSGTIILPRSRWNLLDPDLLGWAFSDCPSPAFLHDLFELRAIVEPRIAWLAAQRRTKTELSLLDKSVRLMRATPPASAEAEAARLCFHEILITATRNAALISLGSGLLFLARRTPHPADAGAYGAVLDGVNRADDAEAEMAMATLLGQSR